MTMRLLLLAGHDAAFIAAAREGARLAFPAATVRLVENSTVALAPDPAEGLELLALENPSAAEIAAALHTLDGAKLPRWAVVVFGESPGEGVETLSRPDWDGRQAARAFRSAAALHRLRRENAQFRGDLTTFGIRIPHDLRTPLGGILTSAESLEESVALGQPLDVALIRPIVDSGGDLVKLIQQMSLLAKASGTVAAAQRFKMGAVVWAVLERLESQILKREATVIPPETWPEAMGNPAWTEAIWWNLVDNALRHAGPKPPIELGWRPEGEQTRFWVKDAGTGVAPEKRRALFQPFHRLHEANAVRGLGLPIVRRLVELQGGRCGFESPAAGGSLFFFTLPALDGG
jgi:signal transduction histidine kinase